MSQYVPTRYKVLCIIDKRCRVKSYVRGEAVYIYTSLRGQVCARVMTTPVITTCQVSAVTMIKQEVRLYQVYGIDSAVVNKLDCQLLTVLSTLTRDGSRCLIKNRKQVQVDGSRYRGCDGTCVGITGQIYVGDSRNIKIGLFKIINKVIEVLYRLDLLLKIKKLIQLYRNLYKSVKLV